MVERSRLVPPGSRVLVGLSGGPDSTALLLSLLDLGRDVVAAHFDHALRDSSADDARAVGRLCHRLGVPLRVERRRSELARGSLQAAARSVRYAFLEAARREAGADLVAVAHTRDDQVETLLINLLRGTGLAGLRGMAESRLPLVRPLLRAGRADVLAYLEARGERWLEDPANHDLRFMRARVRLLLLPAFDSREPGVRQRLLDVAALAAHAVERLDAPAPAATRDRLSPASSPARARTLAALYAEVAGGPPLGRSHLAALGRLLDSWRTGAAYDLPRGVRFRVLPDRVVFEAAGEAAPAPLFEVVERPCAGCDQVDAVHLRPGTYTVGRRSPGLRMRPPGSPGSRKVQDILTDARVPRAERDRLPVVFRDGRPGWIPGVAVDVDHVAPPGTPGVHVEVRRLDAG